MAEENRASVARTFQIRQRTGGVMKIVIDGAAMDSEVSGSLTYGIELFGEYWYFISGWSHQL